MLTEDGANPIPWTKPEDLTVEQTVAILSDTSRDRKTCCAHYSENSTRKTLLGTNVALFDGSTLSFYPGISPTVARGLCQADDGGDPDWRYKRGEQIVINKPWGWISIWLYIGLLALFPIIFRQRKPETATT